MTHDDFVHTRFELGIDGTTYAVTAFRDGGSTTEFPTIKGSVNTLTATRMQPPCAADSLT
jgi:hypothetical protein